MSTAVIKTSSATNGGGHITPRSHSTDPLENTDYCPELTASISNDTRSSSTNSYNSKKPSRFGSLFSTNSPRSGLKMTPVDHQSPVEQHQQAPTSNMPASVRRRASSGAQSFLSVESSNSNNTQQASPRQQHKFSLSIGNIISSPASWTKKHLHHNHSHSEPCSPSANVPKLNERYGDYVKPNKKSITKSSGATNKHNIGSGATAVIRLVQSPYPNGRILAVKEFRKKDKIEDEKKYLKRMHNEYCISKTVSGHPNVIETMDLVVDEQDRWCTVMEYVSSKVYLW
jgi:hypothetical protein